MRVRDLIGVIIAPPLLSSLSRARLHTLPLPPLLFPPVFPSLTHSPHAQVKVYMSDPAGTKLTTAAPAAPEPPAAAAKSAAQALKKEQEDQEEQTRHAECVICLSESRRFNNKKTDLSVGSRLAHVHVAWRA